MKRGELFTKENIGFLTSFTKATTEKSFQFFYTNKLRIDSIMEQSKYAYAFIDYIITQQEIEPLIKLVKFSKLHPIGMQSEKRLRSSLGGEC